ncbi:MAG: hypothetical protein M3O36_17090, partial [Myxococcota bacterium]|nr:hypothetical protein [Myxococcota bacterium]
MRAAAAASSPEAVRLVWVRGENTDGCADADDLESRVAASIGRNVFSASAPRRIEGVVEYEGEHWSLHLYVRDTGGVLVGSRTLTSDSPDCAALNAAATLVIALVIDPSAPLQSEAPANARVAPALPSSPRILAEAATMGTVLP